MSIRPYRMIFAMVLLLAFAEIAVAQASSGIGAPAAKPRAVAKKRSLRTYGQKTDDQPISGEPAGELLSRDFAAGALHISDRLQRIEAEP